MAALGNILITCVPTPAGIVTSKYRDGDDSAANPPSTPQLGQPSVLNSTSVDIPLATASTGGTAPRAYELSLSTTSGIAGFAVTDAAADFTGDGVYSLTGLTASTQYWVRLACVDADSRRSGYSGTFTFTTSAAGGGDVTAPTAPSSLAATSATAGRASLTWVNGTDAVGIAYTDVIRGNSVGGVPSNDGTVISTVVGTGSSYTDYTAPAGTEVFYRVQHRDAAGNVSAQSSRSFVTISSTGIDYKIYDNFDSATLNASNFQKSINGGVNTTVTILTDQFVSSPRGLKSLITGDSVADYRAEVQDTLGYNNARAATYNVDHWYGLSVYLPSDWTQSSGQDTCFQWHHRSWLTGSETLTSSSPIMAARVRKGNFEFAHLYNALHPRSYYGCISDVNNNTLNPGSAAYNADRVDNIYPGPALTPGSWMHFVVRVNWTWLNTGIFEIWANGVRWVNIQNAPTCSQENPLYAPYWKFGNYRVANKTTPITRTVYFDNARYVKTGGSYAAVDPSTT